MNVKIALLDDLLESLAALDVAIVSGYHEYPRDVQSDVDAIGTDAVLASLRSSTTAGKFQAVQILQHESTCYYWVFYRADEAGRPVFLRFDFSTDYRREGRVFYRASDLLPHIQREGALPLLAPAFEFGYYIVKKVAKGEIETRHAELLSSLFVKDPTGCNAELSRFFPPAEQQIIAGACSSGDWSEARAQLPRLRQVMFRTSAAAHPWDVVAYYPGELLRRIQRVLHPTGLVVVLLGMDGSGKSTIAEQAAQDLLAAFRRKRIVHLRPSLRKRQAQGPVTDPHGQAPRGLAASLVKIGYWVGEYLLGWLTDILPAKMRSTLIFFDRYYHDLLVDPRRYRFGGPLWLARLAGAFVPKPDMTILLDLPAETAHARKPEVTIEEARRLRERYLALANSLPNAHVVDASRPIAQVVTDVEQVILQHMEKRTKKWIRS